MSCIIFAMSVSHIKDIMNTSTVNLSSCNNSDEHTAVVAFSWCTIPLIRNDEWIRCPEETISPAYVHVIHIYR